MEKREILNLIQQELQNGTITKEDLYALQPSMGIQPDAGADTHIEEPQEEQSSLSKKIPAIFYTIGAIIAIVGIFTLVGQFWEDINFLGRLIITLGTSVALYIAGFLFSKGPHNILSQVFFTFSAGLAPAGIFVLLTELSIRFGWEVNFIIGALLFVLFLVTYVLCKKSILILLAVAYASSAYFSIIFGALESHIFSSVTNWSVIVLGVAYLLIGYSISTNKNNIEAYLKKERRSVRGILYLFGSLGILLAGFFLGGIFDLLYIVVLFAGFYGSVFLQSRSMLVFSGIFLIAHIVHITSRYFADSFGWPLVLIVSGFFVIGVGYLTLFINKKYISRGK
ncbi:hypothetical protein COU15_00415 [Candidatus Kaiserbacteria bacterium CG10_big_fil_rev_8_21_14_0_10_45_20]|uniref:DUF2157 domain-containing protein n=1 Tax=Candidatus Kaiserbacteria bacterium CG10_big_fil_rev_8_21_14_0_10_45_20 TaxID=1974607 RepID=A0A2H0UIC6_9BACT|nr:MAG: hypothetical protein COU15_00415 [Candidatus Kaiserbacteria bacterium CG10_big_fil_rev_8_21_14_0_10_45_20]